MFFLRRKALDLVESGLNRILQAKDSETAVVASVHHEHEGFLKAEIDRLRKEVYHERSRAEAAIDELLKSKAHAPPIRHADIQRTVASADAERPGEKKSRVAYEELDALSALRELNLAGDMTTQTVEDPRLGAEGTPYASAP